MKLKLFAWLGRSTEKETIELFKEHTKEIIAGKEELLKLRDVLDKNMKGIVEIAKRVNEHEKNADNLRRAILQKLYSGAFLPVMRTHLYNLSDGLDDIIDAMQDAIDMMEYLEGRKVPKTIIGKYKLMLKEAGDAVDIMQQIVNGLFEGKEIIELMRAAKNIEHNLDLLKAEVFKEALMKNKRMDATTAWIICKIALFLSEIGDAVEDCCDRITVLKMMRIS